MKRKLSIMLAIAMLFTTLAVNVNTYPTHIAGLPVGINICCHVNRHIVREV